MRKPITLFLFFLLVISCFYAPELSQKEPSPLQLVSDEDFGEVDIGRNDDRDDRNHDSDNRGDLDKKSPYITLLSNGLPRTHVDIAIVGDGYNLSDNRAGGIYEKHTRQFLRKFFTYQPFKKYKKKFNVYRVRTISRRSGGFSNHRNNTLFSCRYGSGGISRLLTIGNSRAVYKYAKKAPGFDVIIVMVNSSRYGGSGSRVYGKINGRWRYLPAPVYAAGSRSGIRIVLHELGHSLANLADEYVDTRIAYRYPMSNITRKPNVDTTDDLDRIKWRRFFRYPGANGIIGAYEGAYYRRSGVFRPQKNCMMRSLSYPFCHVCRKELVKAIYRICRMRFAEDAYHRANPVGR